MDLSDGLVKDLERMLRAPASPGASAPAMYPLSAAARKVVARGQPKRLAQLLTGGDDYEVLAAIPAPRTVATPSAPPLPPRASRDRGRPRRTVRLAPTPRPAVEGPDGRP